MKKKHDLKTKEIDRLKAQLDNRSKQLITLQVSACNITFIASIKKLTFYCFKLEGEIRWTEGKA